jgi:hypothetical protein
MAIRQFPLDEGQLSPRFLSAASATDNRGVQKLRGDLPVWDVSVLIKDGDLFETQVVKVTAVSEPKFSEMEAVHFTNLGARPWDMGDRHGITVSADSVSAAKPGAIPVGAVDDKGSSKAA